jgi:hypothetical protein
MSRPALKVEIQMTGDQQARLGLVRLSSTAARRQAIGDGGQAALAVIKGYYQAKGRPFWVNPALPTHGPGRRPTQWWRSTETGWAMRQPNSYAVNFVNGTIGLAHKVTGGTIRAKRKKFLTIPVDPRAHGLTAKTFSRTIAPLFQAKGMLLYVDEQTADVKAAYALKKSITQRPWPGALPPESSYLDTFIDEALDSLIDSFETP